MMKSPAKAFIETFFWIAGSICAYTLTCAAQAVLRFKKVDLPIFGECSEMEGAIYSLMLLGPLLGVLHFFVHSYQTLCRKDADELPHFPGKIQEHVVPDDLKELKKLRVALFFLLLVWPTIAYGICVERVLHYYRIVPTTQLSEPTPDGSVVVWKMLGYPLQKPPGSGKDEYHWWINSYKLEEDSNGDRIKVTPLPFQPLGFVLACTAFTLSTLLGIYRGFSGKKWPQAQFWNKQQTSP